MMPRVPTELVLDDSVEGSLDVVVVGISFDDLGG